MTKYTEIIERLEKADGPDRELDTPIPPTNATRHILDQEIGYGTPKREFVMICGARWKAADGGAGGEHEYFYASETFWHQHVTCEACRAAFGIQEKADG